VELTGKPEFAVHDGQGRVYVNIEDKSELIVFDAKSLKILHTWPLAPVEEPSGLAIDRRHNRLFSVGGNRRMVILDSETGKVLGDVPIGEGVDGAAFDPGSLCAFSSNGEGTMTVVSQDKDGKYVVAGTAVTRRSARTVVLDEKTGRLYTVAARFGAPPPPTAERPRPRPPIEPGSVTLYILGKH
jgi:DNA-binding beta-propeller fold protein YncE